MESGVAYQEELKTKAQVIWEIVVLVEFVLPAPAPHMDL